MLLFNLTNLFIIILFEFLCRQNIFRQNCEWKWSLLNSLPLLARTRSSELVGGTAEDSDRGTTLTKVLDYNLYKSLAKPSSYGARAFFGI